MSKVMILGSGGREHALACWFNRYGHDVFVAPARDNAALGFLDARKRLENMVG